MVSYLSRFLYILADQKNKLFVLLALFLLTSTLDTFGIGLVGPFIALATAPDTIQTNSLLSQIYTWIGFSSTNQFISLIGLIIVIVFYVKSFLYFNVQEFIHKFSYNQQRELRVRLLHSYLSVPYTFHLHRNSADLVNTITSETMRFCYGVVNPLLNVAANIAVLCFLLILLLKTDLTATATILGILLLVFLPYYYARNKIAAWGMEASKAGSEMIRVINHSLGGLKETRVVGCEAYFEEQLDEQAKRHAEVATKFSAFKTLPRISIEALLITFLVGFTSIALLNEDGESITSTLGIFAMASIRLMPSVSQLVSAVSVLRNSSYTLNKLYVDLKELEEQETLRTHELQPRSNGSITNGSRSSHSSIRFHRDIVLDQLTYSYPNTSDPALRGISMTIRKGESIALIGKSGAGKTTLVDLILGLLIPDSGDIQVDGTSVYDDLRAWQNLVGYIPQSIFLMDDTVERNIAFGVPDHQIDYERLHKAIHAAQLNDLIEQLPDGVKTMVGERGVRFSGGQRQRVGIARALYHEREILVLDEATAALDNETESLVTEAIKSLSGTKTVIIIAHRLSTVQHCDCVYQMQHGRIVKSGSYEQVVLEEQAIG
ncbi:ABC transporter ATP-binding protein [Oculatella sp. LEGE 06141]|uniref:ABC transporter ATP-binding protein n=1 Tax=Oculatella sp. LEGE 06141 TaxID=1828648 RepID=UPI00187E9E91|nr:ABC transporter ATP-binding protein [Oculatella sp. LEGE 06141]MBE9178845.1 ABC transporter ATP-binding protein [Oculatella sp. LEGE 06141]